MSQTNSSSSDELEDLYLRFAEFVLTRARELANTSGIPLQTRMWHVFDSESQAHHDFVSEPQYWMLLTLGTLEDRSTAPEVAACLRSHYDTGVFRYPPHLVGSGSPSFEAGESMYYQQMLLPLRDVIERTDSLDVSSEQVIETYRRFRAAWAQPKATVDVTIPLLNLDARVDAEVALSKTFHLAELSLEERSEIWNQLTDGMFVGPRFIEFGSLLRSRHKLVGTWLQDRESPYGSATLNQEVSDILTGLRLLKPGAVSAPAGVMYVKERDIWLPSDSIITTDDASARQYGGTYLLLPQDLPMLDQILQALRQLGTRKNTGSLGVAIRRLNQAYTRENAEDRIIDLTIALESTALHGTRDELSYRLSRRAVTLLATTALGAKRRPDQTADLLLGMYDIRSQIVHNGLLLRDLSKDIRKSSPEAPPEQFPDICEDLTRDIVRMYVERVVADQANADVAKSLAQINRELDERILKWIPFPPAV